MGSGQTRYVLLSAYAQKRGCVFLFPGLFVLSPWLRMDKPEMDVSVEYAAIVVLSLSCVQLFAPPWTAACQASPCIEYI